MKKQYNGKKLRYGASSLGLTALFIAAVIVLNIFVTVLVNHNMWYVDMTVESLFTISDECFTLLKENVVTEIDRIRKEKGNDDLTVNIHFMQAPDLLMESQTMQLVYDSARQLEAELGEYIKVDYIDLYKNPSAVLKYQTTPLVKINSTSVIVEFGTEFRHLSQETFYVVENNTPWAYDGEKRFASSILAVTRSESPVCLVDLAHGEAFYDTQFIVALQDAGYTVATTEGTIIPSTETMADTTLEDLAPGASEETETTVDPVFKKGILTTAMIEKVEELCGGDQVRLMLIYNPTSDFIVSGSTIDQEFDEIATLDAFLDKDSLTEGDSANSMMVFMSPNSPVLPNLEEYLEEWGISFDRQTVEGGKAASYMIRDMQNSLTSDGFSIVADYVTTGIGGSLTKSMRSVSFPKKIVFRNAMSISFSDNYVVDPYNPSDFENPTDTEAYDRATSNTYYREIQYLLVSSDSAEALAGGNVVESASEKNRLPLMTISSETRVQSETMYSSIEQNSYVVACGSTDFARQDFLQSGVYGNYDMLLTLLGSLGHEPVPAQLMFNPFADYTIDSITTANATVWTICLAVIPAVLALGAGVFVLVRRKYS